MASLGLAIRDGLRMWEADKFEDDQRALARMKMKVEQLGYEDALSEEQGKLRAAKRAAEGRVAENLMHINKSQDRILASPSGYVEVLNSMPGTRAEGQRWVTNATSYGKDTTISLVDERTGQVLQQGVLPSGQQALYSLKQFIKTPLDTMQDLTKTMEQQAKYAHELNKVGLAGEWSQRVAATTGEYGLQKERLSGANAINVKALEGFNALKLEGAKGQTELAKTLINQSSNLMDKALINSLYHNDMYIDKQTGEFKKTDGTAVTPEDSNRFKQTFLLSQQALAQGITSGNLIDSFPRMMANLGIAAANADAPKGMTTAEESQQEAFNALANRLKASVPMAAHAPYQAPGGYTNFFDNLNPVFYDNLSPGQYQGTGSEQYFGLGLGK